MFGSIEGSRLLRTLGGAATPLNLGRQDDPLGCRFELRYLHQESSLLSEPTTVSQQGGLLIRRTDPYNPRQTLAFTVPSSRHFYGYFIQPVSKSQSRHGANEVSPSTIADLLILGMQGNLFVNNAPLTMSVSRELRVTSCSFK